MESSNDVLEELAPMISGLRSVEICESSKMPQAEPEKPPSQNTNPLIGHLAKKQASFEDLIRAHKFEPKSAFKGACES